MPPASGMKLVPGQTGPPGVSNTLFFSPKSGQMAGFAAPGRPIFPSGFNLLTRRGTGSCVTDGYKT